MPDILQLAIINGPNLNLLGTREPEKYGNWTLADIEALCSVTAAGLGYDLDFMQSNHEGELIDAIHRAGATSSGIVINPAAYTHTSVALADALAAVALPVVEVHLTNTAAREDFRHHSYVSAQATAVIAGAGSNGYRFAIEHLVSLLNTEPVLD